MKRCIVCKKHIYPWQKKDIRCDMIGTVLVRHMKCIISLLRDYPYTSSTDASYIDWDNFEWDK